MKPRARTIRHRRGFVLWGVFKGTYLLGYGATLGGALKSAQAKGALQYVRE